MNLNQYEGQDESAAISSNATNGSDHGTDTLAKWQEPQWLIIVYFTLLASGGIINLLHTLALIRSRRNGNYAHSLFLLRTLTHKHCINK
jgi:hypothetical protein